MKNKEEKYTESFDCGNGLIAMKNIKGLWVYKSVNSEKLQPPKKLTIKEHDLPAYKIIVEYEDNYKKKVEDYLANTTKDLVRKMKSIIK